jgi:hypothetical protein
MTDKEAMKLALFALDIVKMHYTQSRHVNEAITALKERLADPMREMQRLGQEIEQEPVAWPTLTTDEREALERFHETWEDDQGYDVPKPMMKRLAKLGVVYSEGFGRYGMTAFGLAVLQSTPPQRTEQEQKPAQRKPLTDKAITKVIDSMPRGINGWMSDWDLYEFARAIEARLKENT